MATKYEIADYLVNLHTLIDAQRQNGNSTPSTTLADEYEKNWGELKDIITKENEDEARKRK